MHIFFVIYKQYNPIVVSLDASDEMSRLSNDVSPTPENTLAPICFMQ